MAKQQEIQYIDLKDLHLWTENPRDPIGVKTNQDIADRAISPDGRNKWSIRKLRGSMEKQEQKIYHLNEIPTVARKKGKLVVYDGNRRVLIGMLIHGIVKAKDWKNPTNFEFPKRMPCNLCDEKTALAIVDRMHADNGTWKPLERDIFKRKHMRESPSDFLVLEDATKLISLHTHLNVGFVKREIFNATNLHKMGFSTNKGKLKHCHNSNEDAMKVLKKVSEIVEEEEITTRKRRGEIISVLQEDNSIKRILSKAKSNSNYNLYRGPDAPKMKQRKTKKKEHELFGGKLNLQKKGDTLEIYEDIRQLYKHFQNKNYYIPWTFIRVGLRLLCESAAKEPNAPKWTKLVRDRFQEAKEKLSKDEKTTLRSQGIHNKDKLIELLQSGAHNYTAANNQNQAVAISLILGKIIELEVNKNGQA